jgi:hypothetical protein
LLEPAVKTGDFMRFLAQYRVIGLDDFTYCHSAELYQLFPSSGYGNCVGYMQLFGDQYFADAGTRYVEYNYLKVSVE